ncbi:cation diffusion facilitator family transporter [Aurantibacillus circumpalustris]|uniref:cation diffusion facilitator family transporter n=1 Tax=Aurantibacillus circumpalustris TaxID=3036359 RepID=UPI00295BE470|nr:cation diffusion facilitator family transporter [Aurantibacillus circumpalustris]
MKAEQKVIKIIYLSIIGNTFLAIVKGVAGVFGNSYALIADAIESVSDIFSSLLLLFGIKYANKPADENHPYGHGRAEPLVTFLVVGFLVCSAVIIFYHSIHNIVTPHELPKPFTLIILGFIIIIKELFYRIVLKKAEQTHSSAIKADAWHHRSDAITSLAAFIGISIALFLGKGYEAADDWAALFAAVIILYNSYLIFRPALGEIMDEQVYDTLIQTIRDLSKNVEGVLDTEKCLIRKTGMKYHVDLHIIVAAHITVKEGHDIAHKLKDHLRKELEYLANVLIHVEPNQ